MKVNVDEETPGGEAGWYRVELCKPPPQALVWAVCFRLSDR